MTECRDDLVIIIALSKKMVDRQWANSDRQIK